MQSESKKPLNILLISPPNFRLSNPYISNTGSIEQHIYILANDLTQLGHKVTIFATGDADVPKGVKLRYFYTKTPKNYYKLTKKEVQGRDITHSTKALRHIDHKYDFISSHTMSTIPLFDLLNINDLKVPSATTLHWPLTDDRLSEYLLRFRHQPLIAISRHQKKALRKNNVIGVVNHGLDIVRWPFQKKKQNYLLFIGKIIPEKGVDLAVEASVAARVPLIIAGKPIEERYPGFFDTKIKPYLGKGVTYTGETTGTEKLNLIKNARGFLGPGRWAEPFGLVFIEAQACGTPVIAWNPRSSNDSITSGKTGFIVKARYEKQAVKGLIRAIKNLDRINPKDCRMNIVKNFSSQETVKNYERIIYNSI